MTRGEAPKTKVHYKGKEDDFLCFIDDFDTYKKWKEDKSIPMAQFISTFKVFVTHKQGAQGTYDTPSNGMLTSEFGTTKDEDVIKIILDAGVAQQSEFPDRQGSRNDSQGLGTNRYM